VNEIETLSDLLSLLSAKPEGPLEVRIPQALHENLKGCLELGVAELITYDSTCLPPRTALDFRLGIARKSKVSGQGFFHPGEIAGDLSHKIMVSKSLLEEGVAWVGSYCHSERLDAILNGMTVLTVTCTGSEVEASREHLQELVDWLDCIVDSRPNLVATKLRKNVKELNQFPLLPKIKIRDR
jgi:hypothetical protein